MKMHPSVFDVFCCLLGIFMVFNVLTSAYFTESPEKTLPSINLGTVENAESPGVTAHKPMNISAKPDHDKVVYFVENESVDIAGLEKKLSEAGPQEVVLRIDGEIKHSVSLKLLEMCSNQGIKNISFAAKATGKKGV